MDEQISFHDHSLEEAVRGELKMPAGPIGRTQMRGITGLCLDRRQALRDLTDVKHCVHLSILSVQNTQVIDLSPLSGLRALETLSINSTPVADLSPLSNMTNLHRLYIGGTNVTDVSPLSSLIGLRYISLSYSPVSDIQPLIDLCRKGGLKKGEVFLWGTPLSAWARAEQVPALARLDVEVHV